MPRVKALTFLFHSDLSSCQRHEQTTFVRKTFPDAASASFNMKQVTKATVERRAR